MANELISIPTNLPAHVTSLYASLFGINKDATDGIGAGMYPFIKLNSTRFVLVKDGEESSVKSLEMKVVVLKAKSGFEKKYYSKKYDPNATEAIPPDCWSVDGVRPDSSSPHVQNASCAGCDKNQFNTGTAQDGSPGKGKACSDRKVLAVLYPNPETKALEVYGFSLPPASLKAFGAYVATLSANNIPLPAALTIVGFDDKQSYPVLTFKFGGLMGEKELGAVVQMIDSPEAKAIIEWKAQPVQSALPPAMTPKPVEPVVEEQCGFGFEPAPVVEKEKKPRTPAKPKDKPVEAEPAPASPAMFEDGDGDVSDDALSAMLGINL